VFHIGFAGIIYFHTIFHIPSPSNPLVITIKPEDIYRFYATTTFLFYILQRGLPDQKLHVFSKIYYDIKFQDLTLASTSSTAPSQIFMAAILALLMMGRVVLVV
jgi:hypothetical protein